MKTNNDTGKVFKFDQSEEKEKGEKEQTESRLNIEVMNASCVYPLEMEGYKNL